MFWQIFLIVTESCNFPLIIKIALHGSSLLRHFYIPALHAKQELPVYVFSCDQTNFLYKQRFLFSSCLLCFIVKKDICTVIYSLNKCLLSTYLYGNVFVSSSVLKHRLLDIGFLINMFFLYLDLFVKFLIGLFLPQSVSQPQDRWDVSFP